MTERITSRKNEKIVHIKRLGIDRDYRVRNREFLCDGDKLLEEGILHGAKIETVLTCREELPCVPEGTEIILTPRDVLESVSPMRNPQDVLFTCRMPEESFSVYPGGSYVVLENVQDPGNVGTVIRSANAFGIDAVILVGACADLYHPKTVRATMGAIFRQRVLQLELEGLMQMKEDGIRLYGAALASDSRDIRQVELRGAAVAVGSEGQGLSEALLSLCDGKVIIPMNPECESLNAGVAASVLMWEIGRRIL